MNQAASSPLFTLAKAIAIPAYDMFLEELQNAKLIFAEGT